MDSQTSDTMEHTADQHGEVGCPICHEPILPTEFIASHPPCHLTMHWACFTRWADTLGSDPATCLLCGANVTPVRETVPTAAVMLPADVQEYISLLTRTFDLQMRMAQADHEIELHNAHIAHSGRMRQFAGDMQRRVDELKSADDKLCVTYLMWLWRIAKLILVVLLILCAAFVYTIGGLPANSKYLVLLLMGTAMALLLWLFHTARNAANRLAFAQFGDRSD